MNQVRLFIWKLLTDEEFRQLALADTSEALKGFQLSATEQSSLHRLCIQLNAEDGLGARHYGMAIYWW